jgi:hypothetical protein
VSGQPVIWPGAQSVGHGGHAVGCTGQAVGLSAGQVVSIFGQ